MTELLYQHDSYATTFDAQILDVIQIENKPAVILDRTLFYPTSGGQLHDTGFMNDIPVLDVYEESGSIVHVLKQDIKGNQAAGQIEWERRFDHMQQHTGQHILSASIISVIGAETISASLGSEHSTVDIESETFTLEEAIQAEEEANNWIYRNVPVNILFPTAGELNKMPLRKKPPGGKKTRIIHIQGLEYTPCGGTHCSRTGGVGIIKIKNWEKIRGKIRLIFYCGIRALKDYQSKNDLANTLTGELSVHESNIGETVQKLVQGNKSLHKNLLNLKHALFSYQAQELFDSAEHIDGIRLITSIIPDCDIPEMQILAQKIRPLGSCILLLASSGEKPSFVFTCTEDTHIDVSDVLNTLRSDFGVKGGGGMTMVQGGLSEECDINAFIETAKKIVFAKF